MKDSPQKINPSQSSQLYSSNTKQPIVAIPLDFKPRLTRPHDSPSTCSQHSKSEAEDWFDDSDEEDVDIHLTRFGRIWTFLDHLVTPATKQLLSPTHLAGVLFDPSKKTDPSQMVVRKQVFSKSLLRVYAQWRREYGLESITNTVFGLVDTFWFRDNSIVSELKDEYAVCLIVMRVLNKKTAFKLKSEEWHEMAGKTEFGMTEINTFVNIFY